MCYAKRDKNAISLDAEFEGRQETKTGRIEVIHHLDAAQDLTRPEEIAAAVRWLCSDGAAFVSGHAMVIDGGQTVQ